MHALSHANRLTPCCVILDALLGAARAGEIGENPPIPDRRPPWDRGKPLPPPNPRSVSAAAMLAWRQPISNGAPIEEYVIQGRRDRGGPFVNVGVVPSVTSAWVIGLRPGAKYQFRVAARNERGIAEISPTSAICTMAPGRELRGEARRERVQERAHWLMCGSSCAFPPRVSMLQLQCGHQDHGWTGLSPGKCPFDSSGSLSGTMGSH